MQPSVGRIVHYVSYGTPGGEYKSECRAAIVTEVAADALAAPNEVGLCVLNPTGQFFNQGVAYHDGAGKPGNPDCPNVGEHGRPFRYCACGWSQDGHRGGTWHWPERVE